MKIGKKYLRVFAVCLCVVITTVIAAGCGNKTASNGGDITTIEMWCDYSSAKAVYSSLIDEYNNGQGKKDGIFIDFQVKEGGVLSKNVDLALQTDDAPDIFTGGDLAKLVESGKLASIDELPGSEEFLKYYKDNNLLKDRVTDYNGKTYKVPVAATLRGLIYNKDMFKKAGIVDENGEATPPETLDEMVEYAKRLTDSSKKQYGYIIPFKWSAWLSSDVTDVAVASLGYSGYDFKTDKYRYEDMAPVLDTYVKMIKDGSCYPGMESIDNDQARAYFAAGRIGMKMAYSFDVGVLNDQFPAECDWGVAPLPVLDKDNKFYQPVNYGYSVTINKKSAEEYGDKIMTVLNVLYGEDFQRKLYEGGVSIPIKPEVIASAKFGSDVKKGWEDFGKLIEISKYVGKTPDVEWSNIPSLNDSVADILKGKKIASDVLSRHSKNVEKGRQEYYSMHTEYKSDEFYDPNRDFSRK